MHNRMRSTEIESLLTIIMGSIRLKINVNGNRTEGLFGFWSEIKTRIFIELGIMKFRQTHNNVSGKIFIRSIN